MRAHRGLLQMRDAIEIRHGRQEMRYMSANQSMRPGHAIYGQLYQYCALLRVPSPRGESLSHEHVRPSRTARVLSASA